MPITGRLKSIRNHLIACARVSEEVRAEAQSDKDKSEQHPRVKAPGPSKSITALYTGSQKRSCANSELPPEKHTHLKSGPVSHVTGAASSITQNILPFDTQTQSEFSDLCRTFVSAGWAWSTIDNPEVRALFAKYIPGAAVPGRKKLSGPLLQIELKKVEDRITKRMAGHYGTLQCDGWKNVKKNHLLAFMVSAAGEVHCTHVHNVSAAHKNAAALLDMMKDELGYNEATLGVVNIGACSDASGESRAARSRLLAQMPHLLIVDCYSHQVRLWFVTTF
ncbi:hypothetical protein BOTBODRAFT_162332 [Botryobasidium botryosum FD-172 SS1]|uniref:Uncharacterized protein n=1 Tax=Botryobasidium botryosum (strain FD-172 SS1) TaxID=930990 RepID=A0A067M8L6_BOTB1|nr:hypothetical protein BOTBODRAFT_162332 [Botryobasidium botryosum FD-172 SS1]